MQIKLLEAGNATMGVWLGKQYLGQTDQVQYNYEVPAISVCLSIPRALPQHVGGPVVDAHYQRIEAPQPTEVGVETSGFANGSDES
jgi:hypothetical protein